MYERTGGTDGSSPDAGADADGNRAGDDSGDTARRAYRVAYDGRGYHGFQRQPDVPTVEDALLDALRALGVCGAEPPPGWAAAGRTDARVSALAQTVAFDAPAWLSPAAFTSELPQDVRVWADAPAPPGFHATHDATAREYTYHLHAPAEGVDDSRARGTLGALTGEHDFRNLTPDEEGTVRDLAGSLEREGEFLVVRLRAGGFPRQLVRRVVSLVAASARRGLPEGRVERVLSAEPLSGPEGVAPAPAEPLVLTDVAYPLEFAADGRAAADAREWFRERRAEAATRARVAGHVASALDSEDI